MSCIVENCADTATALVEVPPLVGKSVDKYGPWTVRACSFHAQALQAGEAFSETADGRFRLGTEGVPPRLLSYRLRERGLSFPELILELGHDGIVSQEVIIQISPELHEHLFANDDAELSREAERNRPASS